MRWELMTDEHVARSTLLPPPSDNAREYIGRFLAAATDPPEREDVGPCAAFETLPSPPLP